MDLENAQRCGVPLVQGSGFVSPVSKLCSEELKEGVRGRRHKKPGGGELKLVGVGFSAVPVISFPRALNCNFKLHLGFLKLCDVHREFRPLSRLQFFHA